MRCEVEASCHCGAVRLTLATAPAEVTDCNCSLCRRYGVLWAYLSRSEFRFVTRGRTGGYQWNGRHVTFHHCAGCGCVTHWWPNDESRDRMGVNARLLDPVVLAGARVRHQDGADTGEYLD